MDKEALNMTEKTYARPLKTGSRMNITPQARSQWNARNGGSSVREFRDVSYALLLPIMCLIILGGCSSSKAVVDASLFVPPVQATEGVVSEYRIQPGDGLAIKFYYNPEINEKVTVRPDGRISLQLVGDLKVAGGTPAEISQKISDLYSRELKNPNATVIVLSSTKQQIFVGGEVEKEGAVDFVSGMTALQSVIRAGGFKETAEPTEALVIRRGDKNELTPYRVDLDRALANNMRTAEFTLQPYDVIYVPKSRIAEADKFIKQYVQDLLLFRGWGITMGGVLLNNR